MKKRVTVLAILLAVSTSAMGAIGGRVFIDKDADGRLDSTEKGIAGVVVSDGVNFAKTDRNGVFSLAENPDAKFIFITTPSGYKTYNAHYRRVEKGAKYEFGVIPYECGLKRDGSHSFVHFSDTEISSTEGHEQWIDMIRQSADNEDAAFIVHTGDICYEKGLRSHIKIMNTENMGRPMFYTIGNHDLIAGEYGEKLYEELYGTVFYSFDVGKTHYVVLPMLYGDYKPSYTKEQVYTWLKGDLELMPTDYSLVIFAHDLQSADRNYIYSLNDEESIDLKEYGLKAWVFGHLHNSVMSEKNGVYDICTNTPVCGGIDHSPASFRVIDVDGRGDISSDMRFSYVDRAMDIVSISDDRCLLSGDGVPVISVNSYNTDSPVAKLLCTITVDGSRKSKRWLLKQNTLWSWSCELSGVALSEGSRVDVSVVASYEDGESAEMSESFTYNKRHYAVEPTTDWCNFLGNPQHIGVSECDIAAPLQASWITNLGALIYSCAPVIKDGKLYVATVDENLQGSAAINALCAKSGELLWRYKTQNSVKNTIVIDGELVIAQDIDGNLYGVDRVSGELRWEYKLEMSHSPQIIEGLVVNDGVVYAGTREGLCAVDAATGRPIWVAANWPYGGEGTLTTISYNDDIIVTGSQWRGLYANCAKSGELLWHLKEGDIRNSASAVAFHRGILYVTAASSLYIIEAQSGAILHRKALPYSVDVSSTPLHNGESIIFGSVNRGVVALNAQTLDEEWRFETEPTSVQSVPYNKGGQQTVESSPIECGETIYFGTSAGVFYGVDAKSGDEVWSYTTIAPQFASFAASGDAIYGVDMSGNVYCFTQLN